jgi:hypothetical protein
MNMDKVKTCPADLIKLSTTEKEPRSAIGWPVQQTDGFHLRYCQNAVAIGTLLLAISTVSG